MEVLESGCGDNSGGNSEFGMESAVGNKAGRFEEVSENTSGHNLSLRQLCKFVLAKIPSQINRL